MDMQHIATHDLLTSLPNRYLFFDRLDQAILRAKRYQTSFALLYLDLDRFKRINDRNGHDVGDKILVQVAKHLEETIRVSDTVARLGGDEFAILMEAIQHEEEAVTIAERIIKGFGEASMLGVTASIGISIYPCHGENATILLKCADDAMYHAKKKKDSFRMYELYE
jgi:diguanylate cyclase (GGDEF)-like protein